MWASEKCNEWITADNAKGAFLNNLPACPCTLDQAEQDVGNFITDPSCYPEGGEDTCAEHEGAISCFFSAYASPNTMSGTKCCYDANRLLMHSGDTMYAGMAGRSHIRGSNPYMARNLVPELSHWSNDIIAKHFCCGWAGEKECFDYITLRPTTDCAIYEPPNNALSFGDPHFITMDRYNYTFNGLGEFTLLRYATSGTKTGASDFELQARQIKTMDRNGQQVDVTQLSSVAMKDSGSDSIFVEASATSGMDVYRRSMDENDEWQSVYFSQQTFTDLQGCAVDVTRFERDVEIYGVVVMFKETGIGVYVTYDYGMLAVRPILPSKLNSDHLSGLLGNMDGDPSNDLSSRNNNNPLDDPTDEEIFQFGQTWEIETEYSLFRYVSGLTHVDYHNSTFVPLMNVNLPTLYPACNEVSQCLFDYEVSNDDVQLAMATLGAFEAFESSSENIRKIDACPYQITPYNGTKTYSSDSNKYFEDAEVSFTCDEGLIMVGSSYKRCAYSAEEGSLMWTGSTGDNACIESSCGVLETPSNGSISLSEDGLTATFACQEGFTMNGGSESVCRDAVWSSGAPTCIYSPCGVLDTPSNGSISLSEDGLTATFACQEGYTMNGANQSVCRDAVWSNGAPNCTDSSCGVLDTPANGSISLSEDGLTATFACKEGFTMNGANQSVCRDAVWSNGAPNCTDSSCGVLDTPANGSISLSEDGLTATFACKEGFTMNGANQSVCRVAVWSNGAPNCTDSSCGVLDTPANGSISLSEDGLTATFACKEGFTMNGANQSVCRDAVWSSGAPTCTTDPDIDPIPGDNNAVVIALSVVFSIIFIVLLVVGIFVFLRHRQSGLFNSDKQEPHNSPTISTNGMENDASNREHISMDLKK
ncbi:sushi domain-containing protein 2-like [Strongylocentrotus purpuratus]|uniref:Uncharacterized protein n=1 Tax=Strongylocentrotus purpuratus TaxID=7668 RepID=A0A7M7NEG1_STRPU|nr:sushi domain-containing protein 2-like [Strongylocentrotus purpuratus]